MVFQISPSGWLLGTVVAKNKVTTLSTTSLCSALFSTKEQKNSGFYENFNFSSNLEQIFVEKFDFGY